MTAAADIIFCSDISVHPRLKLSMVPQLPSVSGKAEALFSSPVLPWIVMLPSEMHRTCHSKAHRKLSNC